MEAEWDQCTCMWGLCWLNNAPLCRGRWASLVCFSPAASQHFVDLPSESLLMWCLFCLEIVWRPLCGSTILKTRRFGCVLCVCGPALGTLQTSSVWGGVLLFWKEAQCQCHLLCWFETNRQIDSGAEELRHMHIHVLCACSVDTQEHTVGAGTHLHTSPPVLRVVMASGAGCGTAGA